MKRTSFILLLAALSTFCFAQKDAPLVSKIAFGSCAHQNKDQDIWSTIQVDDPEVFVFLGDNVYGDTENMRVLSKKYRKLGKKEGYRDLTESTRILAVWDDHDYGVNDGGKEYPKKEESKEVFLSFFDEPLESSRWQHPGIYHAEYFTDGTHRLQILLLDNRTFRDPLCTRKGAPRKMGSYWPCEDRSGTMLGEEQWKWLESQLMQPADVRIIATSTQFLADFNGYEAWANMPWERDRMLDLIKQTKAGGVLFISGDTHYAELSKLDAEGLYPIYDLTSSGLTQTWPSVGPNKNRIKEPYSNNNFGLISIDWKGENTLISLQVKDAEGNPQIKQQVSLADLK